MTSRPQDLKTSRPQGLKSSEPPELNLEGVTTNTRALAAVTWEKFAANYLYENGMFEKDAKTVVDYAKAHPVFEAMQSRWNDSITGYPEPMKAVNIIALRKVAHEWIEKNQPQAWYKEMFA